MNYRYVIHNNTTPYIVVFNHDLSMTILPDNMITFSVYNCEETVDTVNGVFSYITDLYYIPTTLFTDFIPTGIETNNLNKTITDTQGNVYTDYSLTLSQETMTSDKNFDTGEYEDVFSYSNIHPDVYNNISDSVFIYSTIVDGVITIGLIENPNDNIDGVTKSTSFSPNTTYKLVIDFNKLITGASGILELGIGFITGDSETSALVNYNPYGNNIVTSFNNLDSIKDIDYVLDANTSLNYQFNPVDSPDTSLLQFDINSVIESLYIKQYLSEYTSYFQTINDSQIRRNTLDNYSVKQINDLKKILLKNSNLINSSFKGNQKGMNTIFDIYCQALGQFLIDIEPSPLLHNFVYRITTSLPIEYWLSDVRDIIHPYSWQDEYVYVDITSVMKNLWYDNKRMLPKEYVLTYLDISNIERYHLYPSIYDLSIFRDFHNSSKFNFNANEYTADVTGYYTQSLLDELSLPENLVTTTSISGNKIIVNTEYLLTGVGLNYEIILKMHGNVWGRTETFTPVLELELPYSHDVFSLSVRIMNQGFDFTIPEQEFDLGIVDIYDNLSITEGILTFSINQFKSYHWQILDEEYNVINTVITTTNSIDITDYIGSNMRLAVMYHDNYLRELNNTYINIISLVGFSNIGEFVIH